MPTAPAEQPLFAANLLPGSDHPLPEAFVKAVHALEANLGLPVWLLMLHGRHMLDEQIVEMFLARKNQLPSDGPVALLIDSPGGIAKAAYHLAMLLRNHCGGFVAVVPRYAKSAATLLALGADDILLGQFAELGPLDVQIFDRDFEGMRSGLDEVQSLERLQAAALEGVDSALIAWSVRSGKKIDTLLPIACHFVADMMRPLFEKMDTVNYTQRSRMLKEAEEYGIRLLKPKYRQEVAESIARSLVVDYPEHGFLIDADEVRDLGLKVCDPTAEQQAVFDTMRPHLRKVTAVGRLEEVARP